MNATISSHEPHNMVLEITPDMSAMWLDKNGGNRPINWNYVSQLARDMKAGLFACTFQGIAFNSRGRLIDGQHRLWAVLEADVPVRMRVFFNEPPEHIVYIDGNCPRQRAHRMSLDQSLGDVRADELATLRAMLGGIMQATSRRTLSEEMELLQLYRPSVHFALKHLAVRRPAGISNAMTRGAVARAWYCVPSDDLLSRFCEVLRTGVCFDERERPIMMLRDQLMGMGRQSTSRAARYRQYALTSRALAAYLDGEPLSILRATTNELFLLPEKSCVSAA